MPRCLFSIPFVVVLIATWTSNLASHRGIIFADEPSAEALTKTIRAEFDDKLRVMRQRIEAAEASLKQMRSDLDRREANIEALVAARVAEEMRALDEQMRALDEDVADGPPPSAKLLSSEGWAAWQKQDWRTALAKFEQSLEIDSSDANAYNGLGWVHFNIGDLDAAMEAFDRALAIDPQQPGAMNGVGQTLIKMNRLEEAEQRLTEATQGLIDQYGEAQVVTGGMTASWFGLVQVLLKRDDPKAALQWIDRYLKHKPDDKPFQAMKKDAQLKLR